MQFRSGVKMEHYFVTNHTMKMMANAVKEDIVGTADSIIKANNNYDLNSLESILNTNDIKNLNIVADLIMRLSTRDFSDLVSKDKEINMKMAFDAQKPRY